MTTFKEGDKVKCVSVALLRRDTDLVYGREYTVESAWGDSVLLMEVPGNSFNDARFELLTPSEPAKVSNNQVRALLAAARRLSNLLARIHRDGGHREIEVGTERACEEADAEVVAMLGARERLERLESAAEAVRQHDIAASGRHYANPLDALLEHAVNLGWKETP